MQPRERIRFVRELLEQQGEVSVSFSGQEAMTYALKVVDQMKFNLREAADQMEAEEEAYADPVAEQLKITNQHLASIATAIGASLEADGRTSGHGSQGAVPFSDDGEAGGNR